MYGVGDPPGRRAGRSSSGDQRLAVGDDRARLRRQGHEQLGDRGVEAEARRTGAPGIRSDAERGGLRQGQAGQAGVGDDEPPWVARWSRRCRSRRPGSPARPHVEAARPAAGDRPRRRSSVARRTPTRRQVVSGRSWVSSTGSPASASMNARRSAGRTDRAARTRAPAFSTARIATTISSGALQAEPTRLPAPPPAPQVAGQPVGRGVELAVGQRARRRPRRAAPGERAACARRARAGRAGSGWTAPELHSARICRRSAARSSADRRRGGPGPPPRCFEQPHEMAEQAKGRGPSNRSVPYSSVASDPVRSSPIRSRSTLGAGPDLRALCGGLREPRRMAGARERRGRSGRTNITWNRGVRLRSRSGLQLLDQLLERQVLVREGAQGFARTRPSSAREGRATRQVGAQHQGVDEEADQPFQLQLAPPGDRRAHQKVAPGPRTGRGASGRRRAAS